MALDSCLQWKTSTASCGVVVGCDHHQEWLLKWWWSHYSKTNHLPVTFFDFGMTMSARKWCARHGSLVSFSLPKGFLSSKNPFPLPSHWPKRWADTVRNQRLVWFTKAFSLLLTPYEKTVWIDLDCQCRKAVNSVFDFCDRESGFAVAVDDKNTVKKWKQMGFLAPTVTGYQTGVIAFVAQSKVITAWAEHCLLYRNNEYSEQTALSHTIAKKKWPISLLSSDYNWLTPEQEHPSAVIAHYGGEERKVHLIRELKF
ncbi:MAG: hypothetical protein AAF443_00595 [Chlamydiota bacterium]